jgi:hypothetical protein
MQRPLIFVLALCATISFGRVVKVNDEVFEKNNDIACDACKDAVSVLDYLLGSPLVEGGLKHLLSDLCTQLPDEYVKPCNATVNGFMDVIVNFIIDMTKHICDSTCQKLALLKDGENISLCGSLCRFLKMVYNDMPKWEHQLETVCDRIPVTELSQACHKFFDTEGDTIVKMGQKFIVFIVHNVNKLPFKECKACSVESAPETKALESIECEACDDAVAVLEYVIDSDMVKGSLEDLLKGLCKEIPEPYGTNCVNSIDQFFDVIVKFIKDMCNHICDKICTKLATVKGLSPVCSLLAQLEAEVPELVKEVSAICTRFPDADLQQKCEIFFNEHADMAAEMITKFLHEIGSLPIFNCNAY